MANIALIPARGGSKRVPKKNIRLLNGKPLIAYTIRAALDSECFDRVLVSSDDTETLEIASTYGADVIRRPDRFATDTSPDIKWVSHALKIVHKWHVVDDGRNVYAVPPRYSVQYDTFSILRPTSPFRMPHTIQRAFLIWNEVHGRGNHFTSLRAVEPVSQHPGKMWIVREQEAIPFALQPDRQPFHDSQMASLPQVFVQNASLEIAWTKTVDETGTISGKRVLPFYTEGYEGWDVNTERDWLIAEQMVRDGVELPVVP